ncbi:hypothetical protein [Belliella aquatica]
MSNLKTSDAKLVCSEHIAAHRAGVFFRNKACPASDSYRGAGMQESKMYKVRSTIRHSGQVVPRPLLN